MTHNRTERIEVREHIKTRCDDFAGECENNQYIRKELWNGTCSKVEVNTRVMSAGITTYEKKREMLTSFPFVFENRPCERKYLMLYSRTKILKITKILKNPEISASSDTYCIYLLVLLKEKHVLLPVKCERWGKNWEIDFLGNSNHDCDPKGILSWEDCKEIMASYLRALVLPNITTIKKILDDKLKGDYSLISEKEEIENDLEICSYIDNKL